MSVHDAAARYIDAVKAGDQLEARTAYGILMNYAHRSDWVALSADVTRQAVEAIGAERYNAFWLDMQRSMA